MTLPNKICLVGFMGVGKTTFGKKIAKLLSYSFVDTDTRIEEKEGLSVSKIFEIKGESYFREMEAIVLKEELNSLEPKIIATGGGIGGNPHLMEVMKEKAFVLFLYLPLDAILHRLNKKERNKRPMLQKTSEEEYIDTVKSLYNQRLPIYQQASIILNAHQAKKVSKSDLVTLLDNKS